MGTKFDNSNIINCTFILAHSTLKLHLVLKLKYTIKQKGHSMHFHGCQ